MDGIEKITLVGIAALIAVRLALSRLGRVLDVLGRTGGALIQKGDGQ